MRQVLTMVAFEDSLKEAEGPRGGIIMRSMCIGLPWVLFLATTVTRP